MAVASFDVFDTVLTRAVGSPSSVFLLLGRRLAGLSLIGCSPEAFARARVGAEQRARSNARGREVTLHQIYAELAAALGWDAVQRDRVMGLECVTEAELMRAVPGSQQHIQRARARGQAVAFLSDMYLPRDFIEAQLARHGLWAEGDTCFVSCDLGKAKRTGELFRELLRSRDVSPTAVTHWGNDPETDVRAAQRVGLQAHSFVACNLTRYEEILEAYAGVTEGLSSAMAGASRLARVEVRASSRHDEALRDVAAGVVAPTLAGFVVWVLRRVQQLGIQRLYFVSRDGQVLLDVARRLAPKLEVACELRYLYGSRQAWHLPAWRDIGEGQLSWILDDTDFLSLRSMLSRVGVSPEEVGGSLQRFGFAAKDWSRNLGPRERALLPRVLQDHTLRGLIVQRAARARGLLVRYLGQEGLLDPGRRAIVDVGWRGRAHDSLATLLEAAGVEPLLGFFFGLEAGPVAGRAGAREAYFFDRHRGTGFVDAVPGMAQMLEMFCAGDHGLVMAYAEDGDRVRPVLKGPRNRFVIEWGLPIVRQTVSAFADHLPLRPDLINVAADARPPIADVLRAFWLHPSPGEASAWGAFPCEDDQGGTYWRRIAEPLRWRDVARTLFGGTMVPRHRAAWLAGSLEVSPAPVRLGLRAADRVLSVRRRARRAVARLRRAD